VRCGAVRCGAVRCDVLRRGMMHPRPLKGSRARVAGARYRWRVVCVPVASTRDVLLHAFSVALTAATALRIALTIFLENHERNRTEHVFVVLRVRISPRRRDVLGTTTRDTHRVSWMTRTPACRFLSFYIYISLSLSLFLSLSLSLSLSLFFCQPCRVAPNSLLFLPFFLKSLPPSPPRRKLSLSFSSPSLSLSLSRRVNTRARTHTHSAESATAAARVGTALLGRVARSAARTAPFVRFRRCSPALGVVRL